MSSLASYILAALFTLLFFTFNGSKATFIATPNCPITSCNNGLEFHYPFWKIDDSTSDRYCGYPGFGLTCSNSTKPILTLPNNDSYYIQDINFTPYTITLIDIDAFNQTCPRARHTVSVGSLPLSYSPLDINLTFYFNCSFIADIPNALPIACLEFPINDTRKSYVFIKGEEPDGVEWSESCQDNVVVAVNGSEVVIENIGDLNGAFGRAMNNGFELNWTMAKECGACEANGGYCGYDNIAGEVVCFCEDDEVGNLSNGLCKKKDQNYTLCNQPFNCGNLTNLSCPFWSSPDRPQHCGRSGFELLNCTNPSQPPHIAIENLDFHVISITNSDPLHTMTLSRSDLYDTPCARNLDYDKFSYVQTVRNLTLYYGCDPQEDQSVPNNFTCEIANSTRKVSHYVDDSLSRVVDLPNRTSCVTKILVPFFWDGFDEFPENGTEEVENVLRQGFQVEYVASWELCRGCMSSNGTCVSSDTSDSLLCLCGDHVYDSACPFDHGAKFNWKLKVAIGVCSAVGTFLIFVAGFCVTRSVSLCKEANSADVETFIQNIGPLEVKRYNFSAIRKITNTFKDKLGQGGFGDVYRGMLLDGCSVAVKVLKESKGNGEDFVNEVASISRTSHVNVVTLLGYCFEGKKKALIYEFMPNGSLEKFIYQDTDPLKATPNLDLKTLFQISTGIARGLEYLHRGCNTRILHFDIKPHNILLDESFCPKISDFGLSRLCTRKESVISMLDARGTIGYIAPEICCRIFGGVSAKSDVYSYGMMILEMVGGRKNIDAQVSNTSEIYFPDWIYKNLEQNRNFGLHNAVTEEEKEITRKMIVVGLWCIQTWPADRPSMSRVIEMLEGSVEALQVPPMPVLSSPIKLLTPESTPLETSLDCSMHSTSYCS